MNQIHNWESSLIVDAKIFSGRAVLKDPSFSVMVILNFFACLHFSATFMPEIRDARNEDW